MRGRESGSSWWQYVGLTLLAAVTIGLCYLALTRDTAVDTAFDPETPAVSESAPSASDDAEPAPGSEPPEIKDQRRVDFSAGDGLPDGARIYDAGGNATGLRVQDGELTHGKPSGPGAVSHLETRLTGDVQKIGASVQFATDDSATSGSVALVGWQASVVSAGESGNPLPATGMRLIVTPGSWTLVVSDGDADVIKQGKYVGSEPSATFELVREDDQLFVVDPDGKVTSVKDPRIAELAGPWAGWELSESGTDQAPGSIVALWAG